MICELGVFLVKYPLPRYRVLSTVPYFLLQYSVLPPPFRETQRMYLTAVFPSSFDEVRFVLSSVVIIVLGWS